MKLSLIKKYIELFINPRKKHDVLFAFKGSLEKWTNKLIQNLNLPLGKTRPIIEKMIKWVLIQRNSSTKTYTRNVKLLKTHISSINYTVAVLKNEQLNFDLIITTKLKIDSTYYRVHSIICHHREQMTEGHYTNLIRHQNNWVRCNDTQIKYERWPRGVEIFTLYYGKKIIKTLNV